MAKLGTYSYPDIRFGDAVEITRRILTKFRGTVTVKGLASELGMAENSGTLFAKVAALRDFGLVEGRGELRVSELGRRVLHPVNPQEERQAQIQAFQRVDLVRTLVERFEGQAPDDSSLVIGLEEITRAPRDDIVRRSRLIQKHIADAARVLNHIPAPGESEHSAAPQQTFPNSAGAISGPWVESSGASPGLYLVAGQARLSVPLTTEYLGVAIDLLRALKISMETAPKGQEDAATEAGEANWVDSPNVA